MIYLVTCCKAVTARTATQSTTKPNNAKEATMWDNLYRRFCIWMGRTICWVYDIPLRYRNKKYNTYRKENQDE